MQSEPATWPLKKWIALYIVIAAVYLLTASGRIGGTDSLAMFNVTQSLVTQHNFSADPCEPSPKSNHCVPGVDGRNYAGFGLAPSIVAIPGYIAGAVSASVLHRDLHILGGLSLSIYHALFCATLPLLLAAWMLQIGISPPGASFAALVFAFASPAWGFSKGFCSEPYFAFGLLACCYFLVKNDRWTYLVLAGFSFGFACASRIYGVVLAPVVMMYGWLVWRSRKAGTVRLVRNVCWVFAPVGVVFLLIALSNQLRFGSVAKTGYQLRYASTAELFSTPLLEGMAGLLMDFEVGLLIFVPWILIIPFIWKRPWNEHRSEACLLLGMSLVNYFFFAKYQAWHGGWSIGPRMLNGVVPFLLLPLAVLFQEGFSSLKSKTGKVAAALIGLTLLIELVMLPYPGASRYYTMETFNLQHGIHAWWSGKPLLEAVSVLPAVFAGESQSAGDLAQQYLLTFPNSVNLVRADLWLIKAPLFGIPVVIPCSLAVILAVAFVWAGLIFLDPSGARRDSELRRE